MYNRYGKRFLDIVVAGTVIILTLPAFALISVLLFLFNGKVFFVQYRSGLNGVPFPLLKFRTLSHNDLKQVPFGGFLRRTSLDELPQLLNVLVGHMSLVGPRPLLQKYLPLYSSEQRRRLSVKPGVTGLVQISGRNRLSWGDKFILDQKYVESFSLRLDLYILMKTMWVIFKADRVEASVVNEFTGLE